MPTPTRPAAGPGCSDTRRRGSCTAPTRRPEPNSRSTASPARTAPQRWSASTPTARSRQRRSSCGWRGDPMPFADNRGVRVHYRVEGEGQPLVLQHGLIQTVEDWYGTGYVDALKPDYRLILVDGRGHGQSDKPHDPSAYSLDRWVADVTTVLDALDLAKAHFWGYSMGGWIGFGMAKYAPERVDRLVIGGSHPHARDQGSARHFFAAHLGDSADDFVMALDERFGSQSSAARKARMRSLDCHALLALSRDRPELSDMLP